VVFNSTIKTDWTGDNQPGYGAGLVLVKYVNNGNQDVCRPKSPAPLTSS